MFGQYSKNLRLTPITKFLISQSKLGTRQEVNVSKNCLIGGRNYSQDGKPQLSDDYTSKVAGMFCKPEKKSIPVCKNPPDARIDNRPCIPIPGAVKICNPCAVGVCKPKDPCREFIRSQESSCGPECPPRPIEPCFSPKDAPKCPPRPEPCAPCPPDPCVKLPKCPPSLRNDSECGKPRPVEPCPQPCPTPSESCNKKIEFECKPKPKEPYCPPKCPPPPPKCPPTEKCPPPCPPKPSCPPPCPPPCPPKPSCPPPCPPKPSCPPPCPPKPSCPPPCPPPKPKCPPGPCKPPKTECANDDQIRQICTEMQEKLKNKTPCPPASQLCKDLLDAMNTQVCWEMNSFYRYMAKYNFFSKPALGLEGCAALFQHLANNEKSHAQHMMNYINKRGGTVKLYSIQVPQKSEYCGMLEALEESLDQEKIMTVELSQLQKSAEKKCDVGASDFFVEKIVNEQMEVIQNLAGLIERFKCLQGNESGMKTFDEELKQKYKKC